MDPVKLGMRWAAVIRRLLIPSPYQKKWLADKMVRCRDGELYLPRHYVTGSRRIYAPNVVISLAQEELVKRWRFASGSSRTIKTIAVGSGFADPDRSDADLTTLLASKDIDAGDWNDSLLPVDSSGQSITTAQVLWLASEANGVISEIGLKDDVGGLVTHALFLKLTITGATQANPVRITTSAAHGLATGDEVHIDNVGGMTEINNRNFEITVFDSDEFDLNGEDGTGHTAYTSGGNAWQIVDKDNTEVVQTDYQLLLSS